MAWVDNLVFAFAWFMGLTVFGALAIYYFSFYFFNNLAFGQQLVTNFGTKATADTVSQFFALGWILITLILGFVVMRSR